MMTVAHGPLPTGMPDGWPIGSYDTYLQAQQAVDHLAKSEFPVSGLAIVGVEPTLVERVSARLTWGRVLGTSAASGAWIGLFVGLLLTMMSATPGVAPIAIGLGAGVAFAVVTGAIRYAATRGQHGFVSHSQLVARYYDVVCTPRTAQLGRDLLAAFSLKSPSTTERHRPVRKVSGGIPADHD
ncbi:general stress protein [Lentzea tibetensis]|nr:general stress protein [Lentzea tibetensis]